MPVDKFGSMDDEPTSNQVQPINRHAYNLDDLENVEGFYKKGKKDGYYCFQLKEDGIYHRSDIPSSGGLSKDKRDLHYQWDIDIQINTKSVSTKGENHVLRKIFNSGTMIASIIPNISHVNSTVLIKDGKTHYIGTSTTDSKKISLLHFETEFTEDKKILDEFPVNSSIIIDGRINSISTEKKSVQIIPGVMINFEEESRKKKLTPPFDFRIVIKKEKDQDVIKTSPEGLDVYKEDDEVITLESVTLYDFYSIKRIRFTTSPISEEEINLYL